MIMKFLPGFMVIQILSRNL